MQERSSTGDRTAAGAPLAQEPPPSIKVFVKLNSERPSDRYPVGRADEIATADAAGVRS